MYCKNCGKEISSEAFMCPNCGTPVEGVALKKQSVRKMGTESKATGLSVAAFILAAVAFVTGIVFGAFFFEFSDSALLLYVLPATTVLPALASLTIGAYLLSAARSELTYSAKAFSIVSIVFSSVALLFLFIGGCVIVTTY